MNEDGSFDSAQGRPFDFAQGRPFGFAQGRPSDSARGRPFDFAQGRPSDSARGRPFDFAQGRPAVFLDRDGTMIEDIGYLNRVEDIRFYPWTIDAIRALNQAGLPVVVVTNQSGIARGHLSEAILDEIHRAISKALEAGGASVAAYYYCPHHAEGSVAQYALDCDCRKPRTGLVDRAARALGLDPARSFVVGDKWMDVGLARAIGATGVLVRTGYGAAEALKPRIAPDVVVDHLAAAVSWILRRHQC